MKSFLIFVSVLFNLSAAVAANVFYGAPVSGTATVTSTQVVAQNNLRNYLLIQNTGSVNIIVKVGSVQSGTEGVIIPAGGNWEPDVSPSNAVWLRSASSTATYTLIQGN